MLPIATFSQKAYKKKSESVFSSAGPKTVTIFVRFKFLFTEILFPKFVFFRTILKTDRTGSNFKVVFVRSDLPLEQKKKKISINTDIASRFRPDRNYTATAPPPRAVRRGGAMYLLLCKTDSAG